jgi:hypothetical protein
MFQPYVPAVFNLPKIHLVLIPVRGRVDPSATVRQEGLRERKITMTPSGIEPVTSRLVANHEPWKNSNLYVV